MSNAIDADTQEKWRLANNMEESRGPDSRLSIARANGRGDGNY